MDEEIQGRIENAVDDAAQLMEARGQYMPALATFLHTLADEWADLHPDDTNGGRATP